MSPVGISSCVLCGSETSDRVMSLVEWLEPIGKEQWSHVPRCVDRAACRATVELVLGEAWPLADGTPRPRLVPVPDVEVQPEEKESIPWLQ